MTNLLKVSVPARWCAQGDPNWPMSKMLNSEIVEWCTKTGIADKDFAEKTVKRLNPVHYMDILFHKIDLSEPSLLRLFKINAAIIVGGYIMDDALESYTLEALSELDKFFRSTEAWLSKLSPAKYPSLDAISCSLTPLVDPFSRAVICMFTDYFNEYCSAIIQIDKISLSTVKRFRQRLSASVTAYLEMAMRKQRDGKKIGEKEFLWQRSADNLAFPVLMYSEVFSGLLDPQCSNIPVKNLHYFHMYSNLFAHVLNDLNSYHRDVNTDHNNLIKLWIQQDIAKNFEDGATKINQFLNSIIARMYKKFAECSIQFPECPQLQNFLENIGYTFNGWILVHTSAVERYKLSPYQTTMTKVVEGKESDWLESEDEFGKRCVQMFEELMEERNDEMTSLYGLNRH